MTAGIKANSDGSAAIQVGGTDVIGLGSTGNINFPVSGQRITGDFSNATLANRVMFQTSTANSATVISAIPNGTSAQAQIQLFNNSDPTNAGRLQFAVGSTEAQIFSSISGTGTYLPMTFYTGGSERMRLDSSGNLGLGVTPSAWSGVGAALQVGTSAAIIGNNANSSSFISNAYFDGTNYRYIGTGFATRFATTSGAYSWNQAASGTAGNTITFTTAMTLDASGNLGIGTSSPSFRLDLLVTDTTAYSTSAYSYEPVRITNQGAGGVSGILFQAVSTGTANTAQATISSIAESASSKNTALTFGTRRDSDGTLPERMRIDSSGNVGIGTTSPTSRLQVWQTGAATSVKIDGIENPIEAARYAANADGSVIFLAKSRNATVGSHTILQNGDQIGVLQARGSNGTSFVDAASIVFAVDGTPGAGNDMPGRIVFNTSADGTVSLTERVRIDASGYTQFSSNLVMPYQGAPTSKAAAATLTGAELVTGILNTTGTTYTITLPTGTNIEGALTWSANNVSLDWYVINTASGTITIGANGNTTLGSLTIATGTSAHFRIRRTAANTFTVYRL